MLETKEDRLKKYQEFSENKVISIVCPVCNAPFTNSYSLSNHFLIRGFKNGTKFIDEEHKNYWENQKAEEKERHKKEVLSRKYELICRHCGKPFSEGYEHRFSKQCPDCRIKFPQKNKKPQSVFKQYPCSRCGTPITVKLGSNNKVCEDCRKKEKNEEVQKKLKTPLHLHCVNCNSSIEYYRKHIRDHSARILCDFCKNDPFRFKKHYKYDKVIFLLEETTLTRREIKELLNLEINYIREAAIEKFGKSWYEDRVAYIRDRAGPLHAEGIKKFFEELRKDKNKFNKWFDDRSFKSNPSSLECLFASRLNLKYLPGQWMTIIVDGEYERREIDIKITLGETKRKFAIFIDGEAFHGKNACSCFNITPVEKEIEITKAFADLGYFSIRYSETEVKSGWANQHFESKYKEFLLKQPVYYRRNWMEEKEIIVL